MAPRERISRRRLIPSAHTASTYTVSDRDRESMASFRDSGSSQTSPPLHSQGSMRGIRRFEARRGLEESHYLSHRARTAPLNAPIDMRLLDYVSVYDANLMCPICRCPLVDPVVLYECDHCFCNECLKKSWVYTPHGPRGNCPTCRARAKISGNAAAPKILLNILDDLVVRCPKAEDGCTSQVKRGEVRDHVNIYCNFAWVPCQSEDCDLPVRRKDAETCLHHGVCCIDCREAMTVVQLEAHWKNECPDRKVQCDLCQSSVFYRELDAHTQKTCPSISVPCEGAEFGCSFRSKRKVVKDHALTCTFALLAPVFAAQTKRSDEHEQKQALLERKLQILEGGFESIQKIVALDSEKSLQSPVEVPLDAPLQPSALPEFDPLAAMQLPDSIPFPDGPFASPSHHLLSMHETLREEVNRVSAALRELDGRHSMLILNENLRLREEMSYICGQISGVTRQVGWLTNSKLHERRPDGLDKRPDTSSEATPAWSGSARVVDVSKGLGITRRNTDERTKL